MYRFYANSSGQLSSSSQISSLPGALCGVDVQPPLTGQVSILIYDSSNSDLTNKTVLAEIYADAGFSGVNYEYTSPVTANQGIYAVLTGTTSYVVRFLAG